MKRNGVAGAAVTPFALAVVVMVAVAAVTVTAAQDVGRAQGEVAGAGTRPAPEKSLLWVMASGARGGCPGVLLSPLFALVSTRCVRGTPPFNLTLLGPGEDVTSIAPASSAGSSAVAPREWKQKRHGTLTLVPTNEATHGAPPYPAVMLVRVERPFILTADLQPATLLNGSHDDARRPLRCSIQGWEDKQQTYFNASSIEPTTVVRTSLGAVLTHQQCQVTTLVEHSSQFCVEVPKEATSSLQAGSPLLCAGALLGVHDTSTTYNAASAGHHYHIFTNVSQLLPWIRNYVSDLQVFEKDASGFISATSAPTPLPTLSPMPLPMPLPTLSPMPLPMPLPTPSPPKTSGGAGDSFNHFLQLLLAFAIVLTARALPHC